MKMTADREPLRRSRRVWTWYVVAGSTLVGLAESLKAYIVYRLSGNLQMTVGPVLLENLPWWYLWALAVPLIVWLTNRFPFDNGKWPRSIAVHLPTSIVVASIHLAGFSVYYWYAVSQGMFDDSLAHQMERFFGSYVFNEILTYWGILVGYYVLVYYRRHQSSALHAAQAEARAARLEAGRVEAHLSALRMELQPHFLFNTLNSISGLVRRAENQQAVQMLARLGELLRITLDRRSDHTVPLEEELDFLRRYLEIEQIRFKDRLEVELAVAEDCLDIQVPTLILQPLVENAIRHGIARVPGPGYLKVSARLAEDDRLELSVINSGPAAIVSGQKPREGIGLSNTRARLRELYRDGASLALETSGEGTRATVTLPAYHEEFAADVVA